MLLFVIGDKSFVFTLYEILYKGVSGEKVRTYQQNFKIDDKIVREQYEIEKYINYKFVDTVQSLDLWLEMFYQSLAAIAKWPLEVQRKSTFQDLNSKLASIQ